MTWAADELMRAKLGDKRLTNRLIRIVETKLAHPTASIPEASADWATTKATYRFYDSDQVLPETIRAAHRDQTLVRIEQHQTILLLQDTTELNYTSHPHTTGMGYLDHASSQGLKVHSGLAATLSGLPLGIIHQQVWTRDPATKGKKRRSRPQHEKESQRWLSTVEQVERHIPAPTRIIVVADREADIYPLFAQQREARVELVIRATYNRALSGKPAWMNQAIAQCQVAGTLSVDIPSNGTRAARVAQVSVGWSTVQLEPPSDYPKRKSLPRPVMHLLVVEEHNPPLGVKPLRWILLTSLAIETWEDALAVVGYYRTRWLIERYHYVLKSGCGIEELQLEQSERLQRALAVFSIVAWRLLWITYQARQNREGSCTEIFSTEEWQALYCVHHQTSEPSATPPSLREAVRWIGQLGGFLARTGDGEPGVKVLWRGLRRLEDIAATWVLLRGPTVQQVDILMGNG